LAKSLALLVEQQSQLLGPHLDAMHSLAGLLDVAYRASVRSLDVGSVQGDYRQQSMYREYLLSPRSMVRIQRLEMAGWQR
jgi:hypothetical protein